MLMNNTRTGKGPAPSVPNNSLLSSAFKSPQTKTSLDFNDNNVTPLTAPPRVRRQTSSTSNSRSNQSSTLETPKRMTSYELPSDARGRQLDFNPRVTVGTPLTNFTLNKTKSVPELRERRDVTVFQKHSIVLVRLEMPFVRPPHFKRVLLHVYIVTNL